jgi:hypothetical protein
VLNSSNVTVHQSTLSLDPFIPPSPPPPAITT